MMSKCRRRAMERVRKIHKKNGNRDDMFGVLNARKFPLKY